MSAATVAAIRGGMILAVARHVARQPKINARIRRWQAHHDLMERCWQSEESPRWQERYERLAHEALLRASAWEALLQADHEGAWYFLKEARKALADAMQIAERAP